MSAIAVVVRDLHSREMLRSCLEEHGFVVRPASDGAEALQLLARERISAIVLDLRVHADAGSEIIPRLRCATEAPIIALAPDHDVTACVAFLNAGADGAMPGPVSLDELPVRVASALRRPQLREETVLSCGDLIIDTARRHVERGGETIVLTAHEYDILTLLAREPGRVFTRVDIVGRLWSPRSIKGGTIDAYISVLRTKLERPPRTVLIHTVRGVGYTLRQD